jgi:hypothetical protein
MQEMQRMQNIHRDFVGDSLSYQDLENFFDEFQKEFELPDSARSKFLKLDRLLQWTLLLQKKVKSNQKDWEKVLVKYNEVLINFSA